MKTKLSFLMALITLITCAQTQIFNTPPKFKNVLVNNANTKIATINPTTFLLEYRDASSLLTAPTLEEVLTSGNTTTQDVNLTGSTNNALIKGDFLRYQNAVTNTTMSFLTPSYFQPQTSTGYAKYDFSGITKHFNSNGFNSVLNWITPTANRAISLPDASGIIALTTDIVTPNLDAVLTAGNTTGGNATFYTGSNFLYFAPNYLRAYDSTMGTSVESYGVLNQSLSDYDKVAGLNYYNGLFTNTSGITDAIANIKSDNITIPVTLQVGNPGTIAVTSDVAALTQPTYATQTGTAYALVLSDANSNITFTSNSNKTVTIPLDATVAFPIKTKIKLTTTTTSNVKLTVVPTGGVTLESPFGLEVYFASNIYLEKTALNTWKVEAYPVVFTSGTLFTHDRITTDGGFYTTNNYVIGGNSGFQTPDNYIYFKANNFEEWIANKHFRDNSGVALTHANQLTRQSDVDEKINTAVSDRVLNTGNNIDVDLGAYLLTANGLRSNNSILKDDSINDGLFDIVNDQPIATYNETDNIYNYARGTIKVDFTNNVTSVEKESINFGTPTYPSVAGGLVNISDDGSVILGDGNFILNGTHIKINDAPQTINLAANNGAFLNGKAIQTSGSVQAGEYTTTAAATTSFVITLPFAMPNANYTAVISGKNALSGVMYYIDTYTTTTFTVRTAALTGTVVWRWTATGN